MVVPVLRNFDSLSKAVHNDSLTATGVDSVLKALLSGIYNMPLRASIYEESTSQQLDWHASSLNSHFLLYSLPLSVPF